MAEVPQEVKDMMVTILKQHLPNVDDATVNAIVDDMSAVVNQRIADAIILRR